MTPITAAQLKAYRVQTFRLRPGLRLATEDDAVKFVNERGFVYFWPIKGVDLPSLWVAVAGDRPVSDEHGDPGHVTWGWKDRLLGARRWFYGKVLRGKATMISLPTLKYFYALSENYGDPGDYLLQYEEGRMTLEAKQVYEALLAKGKMDTVALRREARLTGKDGNARFERALVELQRGLKILPVGVAEAGAWKYAFIYELVDRWFPEVSGEARAVGRGDARACLTDLYLKSVGVSSIAQIARLFQWRVDEAGTACDRLLKGHKARRVEKVGGQDGEWIASVRIWENKRAAPRRSAR